ncbi:protein kinase [Streptomyces sp. NPDC050528]|uniref:caspase, EACC1-associated type n=1 Tax=Streptomyces sp. NPDC050528 TaxID=3365623 RepID=UPI0037AE1E6D
MTLRDDIDFDRSRAILLGTSKYTAGFQDRSPMPAALRSLEEMRRVLTGPGEWPAKRIKTFKDVRDSSKLQRDVAQLIRDVDDVLLFYYVGHGQLLAAANGGRHELGLALTDTSEEPSQRALTSLRFRDMRDLLEGSKARTKIFILDCCCAGIASQFAEPATRVTDHDDGATPSRGAGTYIWAACGHTQKTYFEPQPEGLTYFTKFLAEAVREAHGEESLGASVAQLHDDVRSRLRGASIQNVSNPPVPDLYYSGRPDQFLFVRGQAAVRAGNEFRFEPLKEGDPRKIGPYVLRARLGEGGAGRVFLAFTPGGQPLAVKLLHADLAQDREFADRFAREVDVAQRVLSSHVAQLLHADPNASEPWLASTYVCGPSLLELVKEAGRLPSPDIMLIASGIARALEAIHAVGAIHRDLKPANVMLDETGPKVIDFGIAKSVLDTRMTRTNMQLGTPVYRSPEQATGRHPVTAKSDIFTLGATIYYLATGKEAFAAEDPLGIINLIANEEPDLSTLDEEVRDLVRQCLAKDPDQRPTAARVIEICAAATGPVTPGAYLPVEKAAPGIHARNQSLRRLMQTAEVGKRPAVVLSQEPPPVLPSRQRAGTKPGTPPPPAPHTPPESRRGLWALAALICAVLLIWLPGHFATGSSGDDSKGSTQPTSDIVPSGTSDSDSGSTTETDPPDDPTTDPADTPTPTPSPTPSNGLENPQVGDCFANDGTYADPDLRSTGCINGVFKVEQVLHGTSDATKCSDVADSDYSLGSTSADRVLCLSYQTAGTGYHAQVGDCVYGPNSVQSTWYKRSCATGNFTVKARLTGTDDPTRCRSYANVEETIKTTTRWSEMNVVQCLSINYPNAAGRAPVGSCLLMTGSGQNTDFQNASCATANVVVTARIGKPNDTAYCGSNGWTTWGSGDFPAIGYTVCFRRN